MEDRGLEAVRVVLRPGLDGVHITESGGETRGIPAIDESAPEVISVADFVKAASAIFGVEPWVVGDIEARNLLIGGAPHLTYSRVVVGLTLLRGPPT